MSQVINDFTTGIITITEEYNISASASAIDATPYFNAIDDEYILSFINLDRVEKFTNFEFETIGSLQTRYLETYYRISRDGNSWTEYFTLENGEILNFPPFDPLDRMWIDIKFIRKGVKTDGTIRLLSFKLTGELLRNDTEGTVLITSGNEGVIKPPYIYKVFKITDVEITTNANLTDLDIKYRFSQDNSKTWSEWEPLTKENISTKRINPIRFFEIEYLVKNNSLTTSKIQDINLIGDFQNVTLDSQKTNIYGIRECCPSSQPNVGSDGNPATSGYLSGNNCDTGATFNPMTTDEKSKLWNPYAQTQALELLNKLSNDAVEVFGHSVQYFVTDPDGKGIDHTIHEFGLFNIVCEGQLKVAVDGNQFPDNQITMNQFDLTLFDSFEVHITKESFKLLFGVQRRPSKEDLIYFCNLNRLFIVDHAQQFRSFNNYATYYKVVLKKYNKSANVQAGNQTIKDRINQLTNNSTIEELFGVEVQQDKEAVANKPQFQTLTKDPIRIDIDNQLIVKGLVENSTNIISKQHYDLSNLIQNGLGTKAVKYKNVDTVLKVSDNIGYYLWFNINNYIDGETYNLFDYYDVTNSLGWKVNLSDDVITLNLNSDVYTWSLGTTPGTSALYEGVWYCYVLNVDQRDRNLSQYIYKRNVEIDAEDEAKYLKSTVLQKVYDDSRVMTPIEYEISATASILVSDMCVTSIRLFTDIIPEADHNKILNQYVIADDSKYLVFADNCNLKLILPFYKYQSD